VDVVLSISKVPVRPVAALVIGVISDVDVVRAVPLGSTVKGTISIINIIIM